GKGVEQSRWTHKTIANKQDSFRRCRSHQDKAAHWNVTNEPLHDEPAKRVPHKNRRPADFGEKVFYVIDVVRETCSIEIGVSFTSAVPAQAHGVNAAARPCKIRQQMIVPDPRRPEGSMDEYDGRAHVAPAWSGTDHLKSWRARVMLAWKSPLQKAFDDRTCL